MSGGEGKSPGETVLGGTCPGGKRPDWEIFQG